MAHPTTARIVEAERSGAQRNGREVEWVISSERHQVLEPPSGPNESPGSDVAGVAAAYDTVAGDYDRYLERDLWNRRVLWRHFRRLFRAGDHVLDAGCGTGNDTVYLAARGVRVTAVDVSARMLDGLRAKLGEAPFASLVDVRLGDINDVVASMPSSQVDGIISSFAALNTVDLAAFGAAAAHALRPGGHLVCHLLSPGYLTTGFLGRLRGARGVPIGSDGRLAIKVNGQPVPHVVLTAPEIHARFFSEHFLLRRSHAVGFLVRPRMETLFPAALLDVLGIVESVVGAWPRFSSLGRFFVLDLERRRP